MAIAIGPIASRPIGAGTTYASASSQSLTAPLLDNSAVLYAPTVAQPGALAPPLLDNSAVLYVPTVSVSAITLAAPLLSSPAVPYGPIITTPITFVGSHIDGIGNSNDLTINFSDLRDSSNNMPTLQEGDVVIAAYTIATSSSEDVAMSISEAGWTEITELYSAGSQNANLAVYYKVMGSSPDTSLTFVDADTSVANGLVGAVFAFRNVDTTDIFDVAATTATGTGGPNADPPSITPTTAGSWIICIGGGATATGSTPGTYSQSGLSTGTNHFRALSFSETNDALFGMGFKTNWTSGAYDQPAFTSSNTGIGTRWAAATLALRPSTLNRTLQPGLLNSAATLFAPTITTGSVTVAPGLLDSSATLYAPTVLATYSLAAPLLDVSAAVYEPSVSVGAVTLAPSLLDSSAVIYAPAVSVGAIDLTPPLLTSTATVYGPVLTATVSLTVPLLDASAVLYEPELGLQGTLATPLLTSAASLFTPVVAATYAIDAPLLDVLASLYAPTVAATYAIDTPLLDASASLYVPTLSASYTISTPLITNVVQLFAPSTQAVYELSPPLLASALQLFAPIIEVGSVERRLRVLAMSRTVYVTRSYRSVTVKPVTRQLGVDGHDRTITSVEHTRAIRQGDLDRAA